MLCRKLKLKLETVDVDVDEVEATVASEEPQTEQTTEIDSSSVTVADEESSQEPAVAEVKVQDELQDLNRIWSGLNDTTKQAILMLVKADKLTRIQ